MNRFILLILSMISFAGCGLVEDMGRQCGGSLEEVCHIIFGYNSSNIKQNEQDIEELKKRLFLLEQSMNNSISMINILQSNVENGTQALTDVNTQIQTLQNSTIQTQIDIIQLQSEDRVVEYVDPCGDGPGFDEVILRTSSNKLVVYFEDGSRRFLTTLLPGLYQTTDQQTCQFSVQSDTSIINMGSPSGPVLIYSEEFLGSQTGIALTCISNDTANLNKSKVRIRTQVDQDITVEMVGGVSRTINIKSGTNTYVTFPVKGTIKATPTLVGTIQTKACN